MTIYNVQPTYATGISLVPYVVGEMPDMELANVISLNCETVAGIAFGLAVGQGVNDDGCVIGDAKIRGISVRDVTLDPSLAPSNTPDIYYQNTEVAVLNFGIIAVVNGGAAAVPGDPVWYSTTTGALQNATAAGFTQIPGAKWVTTTAGAAVGLIELGTMV